MELIVVSIGTLSKNALWNERVPLRTSHATTTLLRTRTGDADKPGDMNILIDPSLPGDILDARLYERAGIRAEAITHVFLTNWRPVHRRALERFSKATWWMHEAEIQAATSVLDSAEEQASHSNAPETQAWVTSERALLERVTAAPEELTDAIGIYPLPGYTPGQCGLIITESTLTTIIAGDAVPTAAHFLAGQVLPDCWDLARAKESLVELYEIAEVIIPGHDNLFLAPRGTGR